LIYVYPSSGKSEDEASESNTIRKTSLPEDDPKTRSSSSVNEVSESLVSPPPPPRRYRKKSCETNQGDNRKKSENQIEGQELPEEQQNVPQSHEVDDLQVFISEKEMMKQNIGSSFEVSSFRHFNNDTGSSSFSGVTSNHYNPLSLHHHHQRNHLFNHIRTHVDHSHQEIEEDVTVDEGVEETRLSCASFPSSISPLPLCETIKPHKIDINNTSASSLVQVQHQQQVQVANNSNSSSLLSFSGSSSLPLSYTYSFSSFKSEGFKPLHSFAPSLSSSSYRPQSLLATLPSSTSLTDQIAACNQKIEGDKGVSPCNESISSSTSATFSGQSSSSSSTSSSLVESNHAIPSSSLSLPTSSLSSSSVSQSSSSTPPESSPSYSQLPSSSSFPSFSEISQKLTKLEQNEHHLKDKLQKLEWINKEFVHELECRERIFFTTEAKLKEFSLIKTNFESEVLSIRTQLHQVKQDKTEYHLSLNSSIKSNQSPPAGHEQGKQDENQPDTLIQLSQQTSQLLNELEAQEKSLLAQLEAKELEFMLTTKSYDEERKKLESEHLSVATELSNKMKDMESATSLTVKQLEEERHQIHQEIVGVLREYHSRETFLRSQIMALEQDMELQTSLKRSLSEQLEEVNAKLRECQEREEAFKETIEKADAIVSDVEKAYRERISLLEDNNVILHKRIECLQEELDEASCALEDLRKGGGRGDPFSDETDLRETIARLEESEHSLRNRVRLLESERNDLLFEIQDSEKVIRKNVTLQRDYENLRREIISLKSSKQDLEDLIKTTTDASSQRESDLTRALQSLRKERDNLEDSLKQVKKQRMSSSLTTDSSNGYTRRTSSFTKDGYDSSEDSSFL
jgi:hypothetical protein